MKIIPLQAVPAQDLQATLGGQVVQLHIYQQFYGVFIDVYVDHGLIIGGVICENLNRIVRSAYLGFKGDLCFIDTQGSNDPDYSGLGDRYLLAYLEETDTATIAAAAVASAMATAGLG